ncbi:hypothetical protein Taro_011712, partial [Colocasia esculenta]|nr:hypothetical protein [Colocasia esculenta]
SSLLPLLFEFLLLWLVRDWLSLLSHVREAYPPALFSVSFERECLYRDLRVAFSQVLGVDSFPAGSECELQESVAAVAGSTCCERGCWFARAAVGFVCGLRVRAVVCLASRAGAPLCAVLCSVDVVARAKQMLSVLSSLLVLVEVKFPHNYVVIVSGCCGIALWVEVHRLAACVLVMVFVVWLVVVALPSGLMCINWLFGFWCGFPEPLAVVLNGVSVVLVEVLPESVCVASTGYCVFSRLAMCFGRLLEPHLGLLLLSLCGDELSLLPIGLSAFSLPGRCRPRCGAFGRVSGHCAGQIVFLFVFKFLGCADGTSCVPVVGWFASLLVPDVLSQLVVWVVVLSHGIWCCVAHCGDLCSEGPFPCAILRLSWSLPSCFVQCVFCLCLGYAWEALVTVWCVALSACMVGAVPCVCVLLRANVVVALLKLLVFRAFPLWVSGPLPGPELFQAVVTGGASARVTLMDRIAHEVGMFYVVNVFCVDVELCFMEIVLLDLSLVVLYPFRLPCMGNLPVRPTAEAMVCLNPGRTELSQALLDQRELLHGFSKRFEVLEMRGACSHREDVVWSGGNAEGSPVFAFFVKATALDIALLMQQPDPSRSCCESDMSKGCVLKATLPLVVTSAERSSYACFLYFDYPYFCCTVEVCVVFLDTLTPMFELYVRLRERQQWDSDFPELVFSRL